MASIGYGYSRCEVLYLATDLAISLGKKKPTDPILSSKFYYKFLERWPDLTTRKTQKLSMLRARCASKEQLSNYFKELGTIMTQNGLHDKPHKIYNIDESVLQTEHTSPNVVHDIDTQPQSVTSPRSSNVTIIGAGNAIGNAIPPYYIFPGKKFDRSLLLDGTPAGSDGQCSQTGWSNSDTFKTYLEKHFLKYAKDVNTGNPTPRKRKLMFKIKIKSTNRNQKPSLHQKRRHQLKENKSNHKLLSKRRKLLKCRKMDLLQWQAHLDFARKETQYQ